MSDSRLLSVTEAAQRLAISRSRAYDMARDGTLPGLVRLPGTGVRVSAPHLERWIDAQTDRTLERAPTL
jgi:excisionase family DNA binding protein